MFGQGKRAAILELHKQGHAVRKIAQALRASRNTVRNIIRSGTAEVPKIVRPSKAEAHRVQILELYSRCRGSLVRLHKELLAQGAQLSYPPHPFCPPGGHFEETVRSPTHPPTCG